MQKKFPVPARFEIVAQPGNPTLKDFGDAWTNLGTKTGKPFVVFQTRTDPMMTDIKGKDLNTNVPANVQPLNVQVTDIGYETMDKPTVIFKGAVKLDGMNEPFQIKGIYQVGQYLETGGLKAMTIGHIDILK